MVSIFWTYMGYPISLLVLSNFFKPKGKIADDSFLPTVTMMVMTYNEAKTIELKIKNSLDLDYPLDKLEIMIVDSASTDGTQDIVRKFNSVKLLEQDVRRGKASAINFGMNHASGEIIVITDGNAPYNKEAIKKLVRHFRDENVGGVCGQYEARNLKNTDMGSGGSIYWKLEKLMREKESAIDSVIHMSGEITAFRKGIIDKVDDKSLTEDFDMAINIRKNGHRLVYEPEAIAWEPTPTNVEEEMIQKKRRVVGTLQTLLKYWYVLFNPKYGWYGTLILPSHKLFQMLSPFFFIALFIASFGNYYITHSVIVLGVIYLQMFGYALSIISIIISHFKSNLTFMPLILSKYVVILQIIVLAGWWDYIRGSYQVTWEKIESSRDL